jgi:RimJ/RimL family protein N-acetyltransferase
MSIKEEATMMNYYDLRLETNRIYTRPVVASDATVWSEFFDSVEATEFFQPLPYENNQEKAAFWIGRQIQRYADRRYGLQAIVDKESNAFMGLCGLLSQEVDGKPELEVGYHFIKKYWGNGFAPEAARLFIAYTFEHKLAESVISIIDHRNVRSQKVAEKNGLKIEKRTTWNELDVFIYRIDHEEFSRQF